MKTFVPITDELLYGPKADSLPLVPYRVGLPCFHWQAEIDRDGVREVFGSVPGEAGESTRDAGELRRKAC